MKKFEIKQLMFCCTLLYGRDVHIWLMNESLMPKPVCN